MAITKRYLKRGAKRAVELSYVTFARIPCMSWLITRYHLLRNSRKQHRCLEIGPGESRVSEFESLDCWPNWHADYVMDATKKLAFPSNTFDVVYASHILEHVPWYQLEDTLREWVRILKPDGVLEVFVPNGLEICRAFVDFETTGEDRTHLDGWYRFNPEKDPCLWASGRIYTYGDGTGEINNPNWHRAIFSPRYLKLLFERAGLTDIHKMDSSDVRAYDHGWINLGMRGRKP